MNTHKITRIRGGHVINPATGESCIRDLWIVNGRIAEAPKEPLQEECTEIDAANCHVLPGLVDLHVHMFAGGSELGFQPDSALLSQGVTMAVDMGTTGVGNYDAFYSDVLARTSVRAYAFLHVCPSGLPTVRYLENIDPKHFDGIAIRDAFARRGDSFRGIKVRQSIEIAGELGLKPLEAAIRIADDLGVPVAVHTTDPAGKVENLAAMLRPGDIFSHVFHGRGETIIDDAGKVRPGVRKARERGVLFDTADGRVHYGFRSIQCALEQGFYPDTISTDMTRISMWTAPVFGLPFMMSKYMALGMSLEEVTKAATLSAVKALGLDHTIYSTLSPGAFADVAVFKLKDMPRQVTDKHGVTVDIPRILVPQLTMRDGLIVYRNIEF